MTEDCHISPYDAEALRRLAERKAEIAQDPVNLERKEAWLQLDAGTEGRVMVLAEHEGVKDPRKPMPDSTLECEGEWARTIEARMRNDIYQFEVLKDDHVAEPRVTINWNVTASDYGVDVVMHGGDSDGQMGSRRWDAPIADLDRDFDKLKPRTFSVDREATLEKKAVLESALAGILDVQLRGSFYWTMGMTIQAIQFIGLEGLMLAMYDNPEGLHRLMGFLRDDHLAFAEWLQAERLYSLNNENDYIGSGSMGYTRDLPQSDRRKGDPVRMKDLWVLLESQETVGVSPELFEEFIFPYQVSIAESFGKVYYGCCEPINERIHIVKRLPHLARAAVSPWADQAAMASALGTDFVFSRKPNPAMISTSTFDEDAIRQDIRQTLNYAGQSRLEIIMKDVHTLNNEPERLPRWVEIARDVIGK